MRVAGDATADLIDALSRTQAEQENALQQISSGRRISVASDDPAAFSTWLENRSSTSRNDEFLHSVSTLKALFQTADSTLNSVVTGLERAISLGVRGSTGTLSDSDRAAIAQEISGIRANLLGLANTTFHGTYVFAGTQTQTKPFADDLSSPSGVAYLGNSGIVTTAIGEGRTLQMNIPGKDIFAHTGSDVFQSLADLESALRSDDPAATAKATSDVQAAFEYVTCQRVFYGNAVSQISSDENSLNADHLELARQENEIAGADQAETISRLLQAQTARDAALAAAGKISKLTLLDYLG